MLCAVLKGLMKYVVCCAKRVNEVCCVLCAVLKGLMKYVVCCAGGGC